ncbi:transcriptional regulator, MerR family [Desulfuromonas soudanensis]|uniref:Transcriptional regulator, MerR family n=2 Tax=Desulfuromonas soudanensis TaxID=1603606 RepID=A0A0M4D133_9BACT|nr:transcriptional regulator, MerR family [Desulfuromonas soudanensis]
MDDKIPDKLFFKIGEVAALTGVKAHVLRYWESEFVQFRLKKSTSNQRLYRRKDIDLVLLLKDLLYEQGFTLAGAKKKLDEGGADDAEPETEAFSGKVCRDLLLEIREELRALRNSIQTSP